MSFILDALKKSESDRQRQTGPALFEVKIAPPKARFPLWAIAIAALLAINMVVVGWLLLRRTGHEDAAATAASNTSTAPPTSSQFGAPPQVRPDASTPGAPTSNSPGNANVRPADAQGAGNSQPPNSQWRGNAANSSPPPARNRSTGSAAMEAPGDAQGASNENIHEPTLAAGVTDSAAAGATDPASGATGGATDSTGGGNGSGSNPDDYAPATEPGSPFFKGRVKRGTESGVPMYQDAALMPGANLPPLRLDLHVYAAKPQDRFALINMHKLHEGDSLAGGVRVESITPDGVVVSHNGSKFWLPRD